MVDRLALAYASSPLLFWLLGSVLAYGLGTNLLWLTRAQNSRRSLATNLLVQVGRFAFFLGIPYLALGGWPVRPFQGLLLPNHLGLVGLTLDWPLTRWLEAAGLGLGLGLVVLIMLLFARHNANRGDEGGRLDFPPRPWWALLVDGLYHEAHWAFYRAAIIVLRDDLYTGVFFGLGLVFLEWSLNPLWRRGWQSRERAAVQWLRAALVLVSAIVFLLTRNLWICLGVHWALELTVWYLGRAPVQDVDLKDLQIRQ